MRELRDLPRLAALLALTVLLLASCKPRPLPDADSPAAQLYKSRCGACHAAYNPRGMTAAMWQVQVDMMEGKMRDAGMAPLTEGERQMILDYLTRNAGAG
ncbi:MAG TPA: hypothetical protein VEJ86_10905 [Candidatus Binataceae bacterium]|nr:hypothetical protein [Candidatus Binataceae bacterium]